MQISATTGFARMSIRPSGRRSTSYCGSDSLTPPTDAHCIAANGAVRRESMTMPDLRHKLRNVSRVFTINRETKMLSCEIALKQGWANVTELSFNRDHLSYSYASPCGPALLVTQDPSETFETRACPQLQDSQAFGGVIHGGSA